MKRICSAAMVAMAVLLCATAARAHPGYPGQVGESLGVDVTKIDPPMGCQLCHTSDAGGTSLNAFGQRLVATYGLDSNPNTENDGSLAQALKGLQMDDPLLVQDLQKGLDPNVDVPNDPIPQYGCSAAPRAGVSSVPGIGMAGSVLATAALRQRRRKREDSAQSSRRRHGRTA